MRTRLTPSRIASLIALWILLVLMVLLYAEINFFSIFAVISSGIIIFVPVYKNWKRFRGKKDS